MPFRPRELVSRYQSGRFHLQAVPHVEQTEAPLILKKSSRNKLAVPPCQLKNEPTLSIILNILSKVVINVNNSFSLLEGMVNMQDWGYALQVGMIGFGLVFVILIVLYIALSITGKISAKLAFSKQKPATKTATQTETGKAPASD